MVRRPLQNILLFIYRLVKATGLMGWEPGRLVFEWAYFVYKRYLEAPELRLLQLYVPPGSCVIDVGANIGFFSVMSAKWVTKFGLVLSIEPAPENLIRLRKRVQNLGIEDWVKIIPAVAADRVGLRNIIINPNHPGDHRLGDSGEQVAAETLDHLADIHSNFTVSLVKIDVQGAEEIVLRGGEQLLSRDHPALMIEVDDLHLRAFGSSALKLTDYLASQGYAPYLVGSEKAKPIDMVELVSSSGSNYSDVLFLWADFQNVDGVNAC